MPAVGKDVVALASTGVVDTLKLKCCTRRTSVYLELAGDGLERTTTAPKKEGSRDPAADGRGVSQNVTRYKKWRPVPVDVTSHPPRRMVPTLSHSAQAPRLLSALASLVSHHVPGISPNSSIHSLLRRQELDRHDPAFIVFACLIPFLVLLSGVFAGLTLGYMSLDETQLNVLSISGTP